MTTIDLGDVARGANVLIGHEKGQAARAALRLDVLDASDDVVTVIVPSDLRAITPSFVQGMFSASVHRLGATAFFARYRFLAPKDLLDDIRAGVDRALTSRHIAGVSAA